MKRLIILISLICAANLVAAQVYTWKKLINAPTNGGKQDDIYFVNADTGWSINGSGRIYKTTNGGTTWIKQLDKPGTYFRCVGFINTLTGFAGNIGTDYYLGVTDTTPLYKTTDGGATWNAVTTISGPQVKGLCAINIVNSNIIYAGGRVGGPAYLIKSTDGGSTWTSKDMSAYCGMILDIKFFGADTGFVFAATGVVPATNHASVLYTTDGGTTFTTVFTSSRANEICWKGYFPSRKTGYLTILSNNTVDTQQNIAKTIDGGLHWSELPLVNKNEKELGIGFLNDRIGWVGTTTTGYETVDGGANWQATNIGTVANKIRVIISDTGYICYAIGLNVYKLTTGFAAGIESKASVENSLDIYPNPNNGKFILSLKNKEIVKELVVTISDVTGSIIYQQTLSPTYQNDHIQAVVDCNITTPGYYTIGIKYANRYVTKMLSIINKP